MPRKAAPAFAPPLADMRARGVAGLQFADTLIGRLCELPLGWYTACNVRCTAGTFAYPGLSRYMVMWGCTVR
jgi:hypothetical protein